MTLSRYLDLEEGGAKRGPLVDDFQEAEFGVFSGFPRVFVEGRHDGLRGSRRSVKIPDGSDLEVSDPASFPLLR